MDTESPNGRSATELRAAWHVECRPVGESRLANISAKTHGEYTVEELQQIAVTFAKLADDTVELSDDIVDYFIP